MLTLTRYLTSDGKYPERINSPELSLEHRTNAGKLVEAVNNLLKDLNVSKVHVNSGFRTIAGNIAIGGSKFSSHCLCQAVDLSDVDKEIYNACLVNIPLLEKHGIYLEDGKYTKTWIHMTTRRPKSGKRIFIP